jgi:hypothetical protein
MKVLASFKLRLHVEPYEEAAAEAVAHALHFGDSTFEEAEAFLEKFARDPSSQQTRWLRPLMRKVATHSGMAAALAHFKAAEAWDSPARNSLNQAVLNLKAAFEQDPPARKTLEEAVLNLRAEVERDPQATRQMRRYPRVRKRSGTVRSKTPRPTA